MYLTAQAEAGKEMELITYGACLCVFLHFMIYCDHDIIRFYVRSEQFWDIELHSCYILHSKTDMQ